MHYAEFAEDESQALLSAIKDYENNKWKTIGQKVGKPAKVRFPFSTKELPTPMLTSYLHHRLASSMRKSIFPISLDRLRRVRPRVQVTNDDCKAHKETARINVSKMNG